MAKAKRRYIPRPVLKLVNEMRLDPEPWLCWTVECGLHSGIPQCCILFYTMMYLPALEDHRLAEEMNKDVEDGNDELDLPGEWAFLNYRYMLNRYNDEHERINYIPCPACFLARKFVKLKRCNCYRKRTYPLLH